MAVILKGICNDCGAETQAFGTEDKVVRCSTEGCESEVMVVLPKLRKVTGLPVGKYDAIRTLREALWQAEDGKIKTVILICGVGVREEEAADDDARDIWACWSEMKRYEVLWCQRWFNSWLNKRYFGDYHAEEDDDD